ncbi:60S large subunit ribosomal protein uL18 (rpL5) [Andalucia godoyi]|uniref:60S large subunit ribosomal protein uL18 (RpL5) n=1 Tax=Andalucia godoyi TaxID=505711 RepID=A0A8K0F2B8_ANDGO|nr:60S large subunit ribosomal protein uL18 (rpL5) [Andalucia godoyi]WCZ58546.1 60S ribosomal protein L5 [Andalucia godoyi]|eukprot:ANDGO_06546.mRNA.1 60S large subunit ribosomal protein uL18 (rpL5)
MVFVRAVKNKAYFKRFQTLFRRRREGKTDYYARKRLVVQEKNKFNAPKYRLVVRFTNKDIIAQIISAKIDHDEVLVAAYSHELPNYGLKFGLTNYAAAYATGLLVARRALKKLNLDKAFQGVTKVNGQFTEIADGENGRPFKAILDVGLTRTTTGNRAFGVLKGAVDGGVQIPHKEKRFPGYNKEEEKFDAAVLRKYIFGGHVAAYMKSLQSEDQERYARQFSQFIKAGIKAEDLEKTYTQVHANIRKNPDAVPTQKKTAEEYAATKKFVLSKVNRKARANRVAQIKAKYNIV